MNDSLTIDRSKKIVPYLDTIGALNVLIVDDHKLTCKAYSMLAEEAFKEGYLPKIKTTAVNSCREVYEMVTNNSSISFDLILLEIGLPNYPEKDIFNGEDLGKLIRGHWPKSKILVATSLNDDYRLQTILKSLNPEGMVLKNEICEHKLIFAIQKVLSGVPFYSPTVLKVIKNQFIRDNGISFQERKFLYLLSTGVQSKEIPKYLPWSKSKVEKQKRILKEKLGVEEKSAWGLIHQAKKLGII